MTNEPDSIYAAYDFTPAEYFKLREKLFARQEPFDEPCDDDESKKEWSKYCEEYLHRLMITHRNMIS
jgi:hypothetical protein